MAASDEVDWRACAGHRQELAIQLARLEQRLDDLEQHCTEMLHWREVDASRSAWYYSVETDLRELVESARWVKTSRRVVGWSIGAVIGALMAYQQIMIWVKEHISK